MKKPAIQDLIHPKVKNLTPYLPGKSIQEIQDKYHLSDVIKLASNENAWGCSDLALKTIQHTSMEDIRLYPNTYLHPCFHYLHQFLDIPAKNVFLTNGSDAIFSLLMQAYSYPFQKKILTHQYAFMGYETQAHAFGLDCIKVLVSKENWQFKIDDFKKECHDNVAIIFIANPNNPTGTKISWDEIEFLLKHIPDNILVVIDEAYYEYDEKDSHPNLNQLLQKHPKLILTRTFSKAYGLASLRLGYAIAHEDIIQTLKKIQLPFTINQIALNAGLAALKDQSFVDFTVAQTNIEKAFLEQHLKKMPIKIHQSYGNFTTVELTENSMKLVLFLESQGIIIRPLHAFGLDHCARITIGQHQQNARLLQALKLYFN